MCYLLKDLFWMKMWQDHLFCCSEAFWKQFLNTSYCWLIKKNSCMFVICVVPRTHCRKVSYRNEVHEQRYIKVQSHLTEEWDWTDLYRPLYQICSLFSSFFLLISVYFTDLVLLILNFFTHHNPPYFKLGYTTRINRFRHWT